MSKENTLDDYASLSVTSTIYYPINNITSSSYSASYSFVPIEHIISSFSNINI